MLLGTTSMRPDVIDGDTPVADLVCRRVIPRHFVCEGAFGGWWPGRGRTFVPVVLVPSEGRDTQPQELPPEGSFGCGATSKNTAGRTTGGSSTSENTA